MEQIDKTNRYRVIEIVLFLAGILLFACFIGQPKAIVLIALAGLLLAVVVISTRIKRIADLADVFGFGKLSIPSLFVLPIAVMAGMLFAVIYRDSLHIGLLPGRLTRFAILASMIGATEELLFRGYLQTNIRRYGAILSILIASIAHTAYKFLFFLSLQPGLEISLSGLVLWTFVGGLIFGLLKENSKSTVFPIIGHIVFDIVVYGDRAIVPFWIWT